MILIYTEFIRAKYNLIKNGIITQVLIQIIDFEIFSINHSPTLIIFKIFPANLQNSETLLLSLVVHPSTGNFPQQLQSLTVGSYCHLVYSPLFDDVVGVTPGKSSRFQQVHHVCLTGQDKGLTVLRFYTNTVLDKIIQENTKLLSSSETYQTIFSLLTNFNLFLNEEMKNSKHTHVTFFLSRKY